MSEWRECKLGGVVSFGNGKSRPKTSGQIPIYGGNGILAYADQSNYQGETIIIGRVGAYCGSVYYENKPIWISDNALAGIAKTGNDTKFLYYFLKNMNLNEYAEGSSHPLVTQTLLNSINIIITANENEQKAIASILSSLDNKIDLLHRQNATLEKMAEVLFRQWFVEEAKEEWEYGIVSNFANHLKKSINPKKEKDKIFSHYSIPSFDKNKNPVKEYGNEIQSSKYEIPKFCILFSKLNPHKDKRIWLLLDDVKENSICSTEFQVIKPKKDLFLFFLYGWLMFSDNYNEISSGIGGTSSSHQRIDPSTIFSFQCPNIPENFLEEYNKQVKPLFIKQINNQKQIQTLTSLRDILLPKLMSREIRINLNTT